MSVFFFVSVLVKSLTVVVYTQVPHFFHFSDIFDQFLKMNDTVITKGRG